MPPNFNKLITSNYFKYNTSVQRCPFRRKGTGDETIAGWGSCFQKQRQNRKRSVEVRSALNRPECQ